MAKNTIKHLLAPLKALSQLLFKSKVDGLIIGGISASLLGKPRFTADVDAVILLPFEKIEEFIKLAANCGFVPRVKDAVKFAGRSHVILLRHIKSGINVDLSIGLLPFEAEAVKRGHIFENQGLKLRIPTPEDLIIMKAVAHRPQDIEDIRAIVASQSKLDVARIKYWVAEFAKVLEMPELWKDIAQLLKKRGSKTRLPAGRQAGI